MQAIILTAFGSSEHFRLADVPTPLPRPGEVRVRVHAAGFNPVDYQTRQGSGLTLPLILGLDIAGTIDALGEGVSDVRVGEPVYGYLPPSHRSNGGYAEYACVPPAFLAPLPPGLSFAQAAALPVASLTAYQCVVEDVKLVAGQPLFMTGATGGVGTMALQMAKMLGANPIITTAGSPASATYLREVLGVESHHILQYPDRS
nr:NADP-dependent oxidoreductase [Ktedonobacterales bacterium]